MGEKRNAYRLLVRKPEGKRPLEKPRRRWVDIIRMDLGTIGWGSVDWIDLAHDKKPLDSIKCWETIEWLQAGGLSSSAHLHRVSFS
jgi:hypothetical protein